MLQLADPWMALLLAALPAAAWRMFRRRRGPGMLYAPAGRLPPQAPSARIRAVAIARVFFLLGLALIAIALSRPRKLLGRYRVPVDGIAIQVVADVSGSMAGLDFSTPEELRAGIFRTRLDAVKEAFTDFIGRRPNDSIGLIAFGGYAVSLAPLTFDHDLLLHVLEDMEIPAGQYDREGRLLNPDEQMTAIGDALALACARLSETEAASRIVVLLSDGESNFGVIEPEEAIDIARAMNIRVYTIAVGGDGRAPILMRDHAGRPVLREVYIGMDTELLRRIAAATGGRSFEVGDAAAFEAALAEIDELETSPMEREIVERHAGKTAWPLAAGLLLIAASVTMRCALEGEPV